MKTSEIVCYVDPNAGEFFALRDGDYYFRYHIYFAEDQDRVHAVINFLRTMTIMFNRELKEEYL